MFEESTPEYQQEIDELLFTDGLLKEALLRVEENPFWPHRLMHEQPRDHIDWQFKQVLGKHYAKDVLPELLDPITHNDLMDLIKNYDPSNLSEFFENTCHFYGSGLSKLIQHKYPEYLSPDKTDQLIKFSLYVGLRVAQYIKTFCQERQNELSSIAQQKVSPFKVVDAMEKHAGKWHQVQSDLGISKTLLANRLKRIRAGEWGQELADRLTEDGNDSDDPPPE